MNKFKLDSVEEIAYLSLQLRNAEIGYQKSNSASKPLAGARLKRAVGELDAWLKEYIKVKKGNGTIPNVQQEGPSDEDFGSQEMVDLLEEAAHLLLTKVEFGNAVTEGPVGIARHDKELNIDYVLHFEPSTPVENSKPVASREEVIDLIKSQRDTFSVGITELVTVAEEEYRVTKDESGTLIIAFPDNTKLTILP